MTEKYLNIDLDDVRIKGIADVISNKTCKKMLECIADKEMSEGDIAKELKIPLNTVEYNLKKLVSAGLIEKSSNFFWSVKGKRIPVYKISNRKIVISPRSSIRGIIPAVLVSILAAVGIKFYFDNISNNGVSDMGLAMEKYVSTGVGSAPNAMPIMPSSAVSYIPGSYVWAWFLLGAFVALFIFLVWNWRKVR